MRYFGIRNRGNKPEKPPIPQDRAESWDVIILTLKLMFSRLEFWIQINFWTLLFSLPLITAPAATAAMYHTIAAGLRDPAGARVKIIHEMMAGVKKYFGKALLLALIRWAVFAIIAISIYFWITRDSWSLRLISIFSIYGLFLWWLSNGYLYPFLVDHPEMTVLGVVKSAFMLGFSRPFQSLLYAMVSTLLLIGGIILLGPVMLIVLVLRSMLMLQGCWFLRKEEIPGFMDISEYSQKHNL